MRYGAIFVLDRNVCTLVCEGKYTTLEKLYNNLKSKCKGAMQLTEVNQEELNRIKYSAVEIDKNFRYLFNSRTVTLSKDPLPEDNNAGNESYDPFDVDISINMGESFE